MKLSDSGAHVSAYLNLNTFPKARTSSPRPTSPRLSLSQLIPRALFSVLSNYISNLEPLSCHFMCSLGSFQIGRNTVSLTISTFPQKGQGNARLPACPQQIPFRHPRGLIQPPKALTFPLPSINLNQGIQEKKAGTELPKSFQLF